MCVKTKQCKDCKEVLELNTDNFRFAKDKRRPCGGTYKSRCWTCERKYQKIYDKSRIEQRRKWNKEKRNKDKDKKWREDNEERLYFYRKERMFNIDNELPLPSCKKIKAPKKCKDCDVYLMRGKRCKECKQIFKHKNKIRQEYIDVICFTSSVKRARMILYNHEYTSCKICDKKYLNNAFNRESSAHGCSVKCRELINKEYNRRNRRARRCKERALSMFRPRTKRQMYKEQECRCNHCNDVMNYEHKGRLKDAEVDHIIPLSKGGLHWDKNVQLLCRECNGKKSNTLIVRQLKQGSIKAIH